MTRALVVSASLFFAAAIAAPPATAQLRRGRSRTTSERRVGRTERQGVRRRSTRQNTRRSRRMGRNRTERIGRTRSRSLRSRGELNPLVERSRQNGTLREILNRVRTVAGSGEKPVVQIDLDLTALRPVERTRNALKQIGERENIPELMHPENLAELPGYTTQAFGRWKESTGLAEKYPQLSRYSSLDRSEFWNDSMLSTDQPSPGLADFVRRVRDAGGEVVFNSGRWRESMFEPSREALRNAGIENPQLLIGNSGFSDAGVKEQRQNEIRERFGTTVAVIDDRSANRDAISRGAGTNPLSVAIAIPGFSADPVTEGQQNVISTFEMDGE